MRAGQLYCLLDPREKIPVKFHKNYVNFHRNYISKYRTQNGGYIVLAPILEMEPIKGGYRI